MENLIAQMRWQSGDATPVTVINWDALQTTVRFELAGIACWQHFATETGEPLKSDGTPQPQAEVRLEFTPSQPFQA